MVKKSVKKTEKQKTSESFVTVLAIVSIMGFGAIISQSLFSIDLNFYVDALMLLAIGTGFLLESEPKILFKKMKKGLDNKNFARLTTFVVGSLAVLAGMLSLPFINLQHFAFLAIKGVISIIAIIFIVVQTWLVKN